MLDNSLTDLRQRAEKVIGERKSRSKSSFALQKTEEIIHELSVYKVELEMQNDEHLRERERLHSSHQKYSSLFDFAPIGYFMLNENAEVVEVNVTGAQTMGSDRGSLIGTQFTKLVDPQSQDEFYLVRRKAFATNQVQSCELMLRTLSGRTFSGQMSCLVVEDAHQKAFLRCAISDISQLKQTEQQLRASEEKFRNFIGEALDGFVLTDEEGNIIEWNQACVRITGMTRNQVLGRPIWDVEFEMLPPEQKSSRKQDLLTLGYQVALASGRSDLFNHKQELTVRRSDGATVIVVQSIFPIKTPSGCRIGTVYHDITELRNTEEMMRHAQRMESLGLMAGGIAHDFNNLLQAVLGQATVAMQALSPRHPARSCVDKVVKAAERASDLTQQLLAYSGKARFEIRDIDMNRLLEENLNFLRVSVSKKIEFHTRFEEVLPPVRADRGQLQQIIMNLIINASEAIGDAAGSITVRTYSASISANDKHWSRRTGTAIAPGRYVVLEVSDTGCGMSKEELNRIFDPFFTTKFTGRGLGLAAVLGIVKGHSGGINVESEPRKGTKFTLAFPASTGPAGAGSQKRTEEEPELLEGTVLVIDDELWVRDAVSSILDLAGLNVLKASGGEEGIALYRENAASIEVVLLDLSMPGLSGEETFRQLREIDPEVVVVLTSGYSESEIMARLAGEDVTGFIQKPYRAEVLVERMRKHLPSRRAVRSGQAGKTANQG